MKWLNKMMSKEHAVHQVWSGIFKVYTVYFLFGFIVVYVKEREPRFRDKKMAQVYIERLKDQDA